MGQAVKNEGAEEAGESSEEERVCGAEFAGKGTGKQASYGRHAHEGHSVKTHHAAAFVIVDDGLEDRVA